MTEGFAIIYGFKQFTGSITYYYPEVYVAKTENDVPTYYEKVGTLEVVNSYDFDIEKTIHKELFRLCEAANPATIESKYQKTKGKKKSINELFTDDVVGKVILKKIDEVLAAFIDLTIKNDVNLYINVERKKHLDTSTIQFSGIELMPVLRFEKTVTGTNYGMALKLGDKEILPHTQDLTVLSNYPAYILMNGILFKVAQISANKIKVFEKKDKVFIPSRLTRQYFTSFIKDMAGLVEIEAEGFDYNQVVITPKTLIKFSQSFVDNKFEAVIYFVYDDIKFLYGDKQKFKIQIHIDNSENVEIIHYLRNVDEEQKLLAIFATYDTVCTPAMRFTSKSSEVDEYGLMLKIKSQIDSFSSDKYIIEWPLIHGKTITLEEGTIDPTYTQENDWFDIDAIIKVGDELIAFKALIHHIKNKIRLYELKDGKIFIIPQEWLETYSGIANNATIVDDKVRIPRSAFGLLEKISELDTNKHIITEEDFKYTPSVDLKASLRPYQLEGAKWLVKHYKNNMGACLADDMGLGKTVQTIAALLYAKEQQNLINSSGRGQLSLFETYVEQRNALQALIIMPSSLVFNWERELAKFAPTLFVKKHIGADRSDDIQSLKHFDVLLTTYQTALRDEALFSKLSFTYVVIDEAHYIKNKDSKIFKSLNKLNAQNRISLSGTPIENSLADLWSQMQFINPDLLQAYKDFKKKYQDPIEKFRDEKAVAELKQILSPFILRRSKNEVLKDLPELEEQVFFSTMSEAQRKLVDTEKSKARNTLLNIDGHISEKKLHVFNALMRLRQLANHPLMVNIDNVESGKYEDVTNTIDTLVRAENKILVFSSFTSHLAIYEKYCKENDIAYSILTGSDTATARRKAVDEFENNSGCKIMLLSLKAGGVGLNLTAANYVLLLDPWWNPFAEKQAIGRAHRIGQEDKVSVIRFIAKGSIEEKILTLQEKKISLSNQIFEFEQIPDIDDETLRFLLN
jgi:SNF2 family DNA or RNA helicase